MKKACCLWIILSLGLGSLLAQTPGYAGKKTLISVQANALPAIRFMNRNEDVGLVINLRTDVVIEQVLNRQYSLEIPFSYLQTRETYQQGRRSGMAQLSSMSFGTTFKWYNFKRVGNIAPLGPFQQLKIFYMRTQLEDLDERFYFDGRSDLGTYQDIGIELGLGVQRIFKRRFTYQFGARIGTVLGINGDADGLDVEFLNSFVSERLQRHLLFNLQAGIGLLLF